MKSLFSIIESPQHPNHSALFRRLGLEEIPLTSTRRAISQLKKGAPDWVVADFVYGYSNNYSGVHISNLDVFLMSLQKFAPRARVVVLSAPEEMVHAQKMQELFPLVALLPFSVSEAELERVLTG